MIPTKLESELYAYVGGICRRMESPLMAMNGTADHVHMLVGLHKTVSVSDLLLNVKRDSSKWIKARDHTLGNFSWQSGYFAFSFGQSGVDALLRYILNQKEHHKTTDFQAEIRALLQNYRLEWDERYVWD